MFLQLIEGGEVGLAPRPVNNTDIRLKVKNLICGTVQCHSVVNQNI